MKKKMLAVMLAFTIACLTSACNNNDVSKEVGSNVGIVNTNILTDERMSITAKEIVSFKELSTLHETVLYDGDVLKETSLNTPSEGNEYLIADIIVDINNEDVAFNKKNLYIEANGEKIYATQEDILTDHNYIELGTKDLTLEEFNGNVLFEVPKDLKDYEIFYDNGDLKISVVYDTTAKLAIADPNNIIDIKNSNIEVSDSILAEQKKIEEDIYKTYSKGEYSLNGPLTITNPYGTTPLSALMVFDTAEKAEITVTIEGKNEHTKVSKTTAGYDIHHEIPVLGLYAGTENKVTLTATFEDGTTKTSVQNITTEALPDYLLTPTIDTAKSEKMEDGFTILHSNYLQMFDDNGDTRWYSSQKIAKDGFTVLKNGNFLYGFSIQNDTYMYESDALGKVYNVYFLPNGIHHDIFELENGNVLITGSSADGFTIEDRIIELDLSTGEIVNDIDLKEIFDQNQGTDFRWTNYDWIHVNTLRYDYSDNSIVLSGRNQTMVAKLSYPECEIKWIFADDYNWADEYKDYLVKPIGDDFEWFWGQHTSEILPDLDNNPQTMDIMLFDNGNDRSFEKETALAGEDSYSRAVHYRLNETTKEVEQLWDYGKDRGANFYSDIKGDVDFYEESKNVIITSPSIRYSNEVDTQENIIIVEVNQDTDEVVFECHIDDGIDGVYRSERIEIYPENLKYNLKQSSGVTLLGSYLDDLYDENAQTLESDLPKKSDIDYEISKISIKNNLMSINGTISDISKFKGGNLAVVFASENNTVKYNLPAIESIDYSYNNIFERGWNKINRTLFDKNAGLCWSFGERFLTLNNLTSGEYKVGLLLEKDGKESYIETEYHFTVKEKALDVENIDILDKQAEIDKELLNEYNSASFTINEPFVKVNPYGNAPLSAIVMFETQKNANISVEVVGKDDFSTLSHTYDDKNTSHQIPIYGLYELKDTTVNITAHYEDGTSEVKQLVMQGEEIDGVIPKNNILVANTEKMQPGLTMMIPPFGNNFVYAIDNNADVRFVNTRALEGYQFEITPDGKVIMSSGDVLQGYYTQSFYETDFLGKIYAEYIASGLHHDMAVLPNGNYIYLGENFERGTVEDILMEVDAKTGEINHTWDIYEILEMKEYIACETYEEFHFGSKEGAIHDWLHINAIWYDEPTNSITISGRHQDVVLNIDYDTGNINWILSDPENNLFAESMQKYLLKPVGADFEYMYAQHAAMITDEGNLFLFDNGTYRSKTIEGAVEPADNYSRGVEYKINQEEMTVEQVWEYGKDRGSKNYALYISDVDVLENSNRLMDFGGIIRDKDGNASKNMADMGSGNCISSIIEVTHDKEVVFELETGMNSYRANRFLPYTKAQTNQIVGYVGTRYSEETFSDITEKTFENAIKAPVVVTEATHNAYRLRITGTVEVPNVTEVYAKVDDVVFVGKIKDNAFSFDFGTSYTEKDHDVTMYYKNADGDLFVADMGVFSKPFSVGDKD